MTKEEIKINVTKDCNELVIREGKALELKEPTQVSISGIITTIFIWLSIRITEIKQKSCYILVDKANLTMKLIVGELNFYKTTIISSLELSKEFIKFGINSEKTWDCFKLSDFIKMNRSYFVDKAKAMILVTELRNFKAKVNNELDKFKDDRANYELRKKQTVESNLPDMFQVCIPIFKGEEKIILNVEISIDPNTLECQFICPEATDFINEQTDLIFDEQIKKISEITPDIAILYQ